MDQEREKVIKQVRGLLIASKFPSTLRQLDDDYRTIIGEKIPFKTLGFRTLAEFLKSASTLQVSQNNNGDIVVQAEKLPESAHIVDMVERQKGPKKPPRRGRFTTRGAAVPRNWRPKYSSGGRKYATSSRLAAVSHNQFVDYQKPLVSSKIVVPEHSTYARNLPPRLQKQASASGRLQSLPLQTVQVGNKNVFTKDNTGFMRNSLKEVTKNNVEDNGGCSPGSSRRKKITKMMSEVNLDRDSGNSSPVSDTPSTPPILPPKIPDFVPVGNVKQDLKHFVDYHKLGEIVIKTNHINFKKTQMYTCKITIGKHIFTSYPENFNTPQAAELYCSQEAFQELSSKYGRRKSLFLASDKDVLERIPKMLEKHNGGLWEWQVQQDYVEKYNEQLPEDWLKIIDSSPCIHVQKVVNNYTLKHCKPEEKGQFSMKSMTLTDVSVPLNTVEFKEDDKLYAEVTFVLSANEIWCRQLETEESDKYIAMSTNMEKYYTDNRENLHPAAINRNGYYVAEYENGWYRIRALDVTETTVLCFYIDFGDEITLPRNKIYQMKREYAVCQAQAFVCRLAGLEELYEVSAGSETLQNLQYTQVILENAIDISSDSDNDNDVSIPVYMYNFETGESINEELIPLLTLESASPNIFSDPITEVYVSNIAANGDIYVQIHSIGYDGLMDLLAELEERIISDPPTHALEPLNKKSSKDRIYLARYNLDDHWYRVKIIDWSPDEVLAQIYYIDYGNTDVIKVKEAVLYPLDKISDILKIYPPQAVRTRILLDEIPKNFANLAKKVIPVEKPVILKVIKFTAENIPLVEFFSRTSDGGLFCINKSINMETEIRKGDDNQVKTTRKIFLNNEGTSKNVPSGGKLKPPTLPDLKECFELHVPFAVNPYNFFVQPLESRNKLHKMMERLQERYKNVTYSPLTIEQIIPGNIYASKFDDGNWYRTSVIKVINNGSISVFYCDFGYYSNLTLQQLIPLDIEFMELPYQALKAKLSGIKPKHSNWTMEHCDEFKEMVERKHFYSVLLSIEKDQLYDSDLVLGLMLIDTSSQDDIYIDKELINRGIAVPE